MIRVDVTPEDIRMGDRSSWDCPIALAIKRASKCLSVRVAGGDRHRAEVRFEDSVVVYRMPDDAVSFIEEWDNKRGVAPFAFDLRLLAP